eukprot:Rmarinus@m.29331
MTCIFRGLLLAKMLPACMGRRWTMSEEDSPKSVRTMLQTGMLMMLPIQLRKMTLLLGVNPTVPPLRLRFYLPRRNLKRHALLLSRVPKYLARKKLLSDGIAMVWGKDKGRPRSESDEESDSGTNQETTEKKSGKAPDDVLGTDVGDLYRELDRLVVDMQNTRRPDGSPDSSNSEPRHRPNAERPVKPETSASRKLESSHSNDDVVHSSNDDVATSTPASSRPIFESGAADFAGTQTRGGATSGTQTSQQETSYIEEVRKDIKRRERQQNDGDDEDVIKVHVEADPWMQSLGDPLDQKVSPPPPWISGKATKSKTSVHVPVYRNTSSVPTRGSVVAVSLPVPSTTSPSMSARNHTAAGQLSCGADAYGSVAERQGDAAGNDRSNGPWMAPGDSQRSSTRGSSTLGSGRHEGGRGRGSRHGEPVLDEGGFNGG